MPTIENLRERCREPWEVPETPEPFEFELKTADKGFVRLFVRNPDREFCCDPYVNFQGVTILFDPARWLPIFEAAAAKCREVVGAKDDDTAELPALPDHHHAT
jgi:hypothetical protein